MEEEMEVRERKGLTLMMSAINGHTTWIIVMNASRQTLRKV